MPVRIGVVVFPGSNCDRDTVHALDLAGAEPVVLWHEQASLDGVAAVVLPGGFAYGDYLRAGVIARFSPIMRAVVGVRRRGRARPRHLQRLPGPGRGRARAGRAAAQRVAPVRRPGGGDRRGAPRHRVHPRARAPPTAADAGRARRGLLLRRRRDPGRARTRRTGPLPVRRRHGRGRAAGRPGQPERLAPGDRRGHEPDRQRGRADAAPGAGRRGDPRLGRRDGHRPVARGERGASCRRRRHRVEAVAR